MDLLIKKTRLPETCNQCFFSRHCDAYARQVQKMKESKHEQVFDVFGEMRLDDCPLVKLPNNHGRIVDLDKVLDWLVKEKRVFSMAMSAKIVKVLSDAPTVLEANDGTAD